MKKPLWNWNVSAKGAAFIPKPGAAPQDPGDIQESALEARVRRGKLRELNRAFSACSWPNETPGALPQSKADMAPLALNMSAR